MVTITPRGTAKSIKDIVESAIPNNSAVLKKHNISARHTRAAIVPTTSILLNDDKCMRKNAFPPYRFKQVSNISTALHTPRKPIRATQEPVFVE